MSGMRTVVVDKIASVTQACGLSHEIRIAADISCEEGVVLVVEILNNKSTYNTLELTSGRMAKIARAAGLGRESLYKALSQGGNPELATVLKVLRALGLKLKVAA